MAACKAVTVLCCSLSLSTKSREDMSGREFAKWSSLLNSVNQSANSAKFADASSSLQIYLWVGPVCRLAVSSLLSRSRDESRNLPEIRLVLIQFEAYERADDDRQLPVPVPSTNAVSTRRCSEADELRMSGVRESTAARLTTATPPERQQGALVVVELVVIGINSSASRRSTGLQAWQARSTHYTRTATSSLSRRRL